MQATYTKRTQLAQLTTVTSTIVACIGFYFYVMSGQYFNFAKVAFSIGHYGLDDKFILYYIIYIFIIYRVFC